MKSTFICSDKSRVIVQSMHVATGVLLTRISGVSESEPAAAWANRISSIFIPADLAGVVAQAIELTGHKVLTGPCAEVTA